MDQVDTYLMTGISSSACLTIRYDKGPVDSTLSSRDFIDPDRFIVPPL